MKIVNFFRDAIAEEFVQPLRFLKQLLVTKLPLSASLILQVKTVKTSAVELEE